MSGKQRTLFQTWGNNVASGPRKPLPKKPRTKGQGAEPLRVPPPTWQRDDGEDDDDDDDVMLVAVYEAEKSLNTSRDHEPTRDAPDATHIQNLPGFDLSAGAVWIYPTNYPVREYQYAMAHAALLDNTLVCLPTGLGKTFIAAVVMYNFYRWYPGGKIVFMAPTKPLVAQQIEACFQVMGIPQAHMVEMTGTTSAQNRQEMWQRHRVFFLTPQIMVNDLTRGACAASDVKCLVIDEAHKALGNHAYCQVVRELCNYTRQFRILALSATPGSDTKAVQQVVTNLLIGRIELRSEDSPDIQAYSHERQLEKYVVPLGKELEAVQKSYVQVLEAFGGRLIQNNALSRRDIPSLTKYQIILARDQFRKNPPSNIVGAQMGAVEGDFALCISLYHGYELLLQMGTRSFYYYLRSIMDGSKGVTRIKNELGRNGIFMSLYQQLESMFSAPISSDVKRPFIYSHPKLKKLEEVVLQHFRSWNKQGQNSSSKTPEDTRIMIFSSFRDSVQEIAEMLDQHQPAVRVMTFVGHSSTGKGVKGFTQKEQLEVVKRFREGGYNTLVSTCVGEEGLDIGEVDLIICFDAQKSPIRLVQRMGRTGRKRQGRIVVILCQGREERTYNQSQSNKRSIYKAITGNNTVFHLHQDGPRMVPKGLNPTVHKMYITQGTYGGKDDGKPIPKDRRSSLVHRRSSVFFNREGAVKEEPLLTPEEFDAWNRLYRLTESDGVTNIVLPRTKFELFSDPDAATEEASEDGRQLSLSEWKLWQNRPFPTHSVDHSDRCKNFIAVMDLIEQMREEEGCSYAQEMSSFLHKADVQPLQKPPQDRDHSKASRKSSAPKMTKMCTKTLFSTFEADEDFQNSTVRSSKKTKSCSEPENVSKSGHLHNMDNDSVDLMEIEDTEEITAGSPEGAGNSPTNEKNTVLKSPNKTDSGYQSFTEDMTEILPDVFYMPRAQNNHLVCRFAEKSIYVSQMMLRVKILLTTSPPPLSELDLLDDVDNIQKYLAIKPLSHKQSNEDKSKRSIICSQVSDNHIKPFIDDSIMNNHDYQNGGGKSVVSDVLPQEKYGKTIDETMLEDPQVYDEVEDPQVYDEVVDPQVYDEVEDPQVYHVVEDPQVYDEVEDPQVYDEVEDPQVYDVVENPQVYDEVEDPQVYDEVEDPQVYDEIDDLVRVHDEVEDLEGHDEVEYLGGHDEVEDLGGHDEVEDLGGHDEVEDLGGHDEVEDLGGHDEADDLVGGYEEVADLGGHDEVLDFGGHDEVEDFGGHGEVEDLGNHDEVEDLGVDDDPRNVAVHDELEDEHVQDRLGNGATRGGRGDDATQVGFGEGAIQDGFGGEATEDKLISRQNDLHWDDIFDCDGDETYVENPNPLNSHNCTSLAEKSKAGNTNDASPITCSPVADKAVKPEDISSKDVNKPISLSSVFNKEHTKSEETDIDVPRTHIHPQDNHKELGETVLECFPEDSFDLFDDEACSEIADFSSKICPTTHHNPGTSVNFNMFDPSLLTEDNAEQELESKINLTERENSCHSEDEDELGSCELFSVNFDLGFSIEEVKDGCLDEEVEPVQSKNTSVETSGHFKVPSPPKRSIIGGGVMSTPVNVGVRNSSFVNLSQNQISFFSPLHPVRDQFSKTPEKSPGGSSIFTPVMEKIKNQGPMILNSPIQDARRTSANLPQNRNDPSITIGSSSESEEDVVFRRKRKLASADVLKSPETSSDFDSPMPIAKKRRHAARNTVDSDDEEEDVQPPTLARMVANQNRGEKRDLGRTKHKRKKHAARQFFDDEAELSSEEAEFVSSDESVESDNEQDTSIVGFLNDNTQLSQGLNDSEMHGVYLNSVRSPAVGNKYKLVQKRYSMSVFSQIPEQEESYMEDSFCVPEGEEEDEADFSTEEVDLDLDLLQQESFVDGRRQYCTRRRLRLRGAQSKQINPAQPAKKKRRIIVHDDSSDEETAPTSKVNSRPKFSKPLAVKAPVQDKGLITKKDVLELPLKDRCQMRVNARASLSEELDFQTEAPSFLNVTGSRSSSGNVLPPKKVEDPSLKSSNDSTWMNESSLAKTPGSSAAGAVTCILADCREIASGPEVISCLRTTHGVRVEICSLGGCDYIVSNRLSVERKTHSEFSNSTNRSKLVERIQGLQGMFQRVCLILEKDRVKAGETSRPFQRTRYYDNTLSSLIGAGVQVLFSSAQEETAGLLKELSLLESRKNMGITVPTQVTGSKRDALNFYLSIPNVSYITALNLCQHFSSIRHLANSSVDLISSRGSVSRQKAEDIYRYLHYPFDPQMLKTGAAARAQANPPENLSISDLQQGLATTGARHTVTE
ncbi:Fanconi anemia group M protein [Gastrophryne carolinensis]